MKKKPYFIKAIVVALCCIIVPTIRAECVKADETKDNDRQLIRDTNYYYTPGKIDKSVSNNNNLGVASDGFSFFLFNKLDMHHGDACGRVAVQKTVSWSEYHISGDLLTGDGASITLDHKENVYGGIFAKSNEFFENAYNDLKVKSVKWASIRSIQEKQPEVTGDSSSRVLTLTGKKDSKFNAFNINSSDLNVKEVKITDSNNADNTILINVRGDNFKMPVSIFLNNIQLSPQDSRCCRILWNFPDAKTLYIGDIRGSMLAPDADVYSYATGNIAGTLVAQSLITNKTTGEGWEGHLYPFSGWIDNSKIPHIQMPLTGGSGTRPYILIGILIMVISFGLYKRKLIYDKCKHFIKNHWRE